MISRKALRRLRITFVLLPLSFLFFETISTQHRNRKLTVESGTFQQVPVVYVNEVPLDSTVHCIGGSFGKHNDQDWLSRSCEFRNICFDLDKEEFVLFPSTEEQELMELLKGNPLVSVSTVSSPNSFQIALGAVELLDPRRLDDRERIETQENNLKWFPRVLNEKDTKGYYALPESHILVPFQESYPLTADSLVNKDYLSLFTLLYEFGFESKKPVFLRHGNTLPACDKDCESMLKEYLKVAGSTPVLSGIEHRASSLVCAKYGVAGLGLLMTGTGPVRDKDGSWTYTHTVGRHATKRAFQDYLTATL